MDLGFEKNDRFAVWLPNRSENVVMSYVASKLGLIKVRQIVDSSINHSNNYRSRSISIQLMLHENLPIV